MRTKRTMLWMVAAAMIVVIAACGGGGGGGGTSQNLTYTVIYDGNNGDNGSVPIDSTSYEQGQIVTVLGNAGGLVKSGYAFAGWNTQANGNGTTYTQAQTFVMGVENVTLYAKWTANPTYTVTYDGNGYTGGSVPIDSTNYEQGQTVMVLGNTKSLVKAGYSFAGWNTQANGNGTTYTQAQTLAMGTANVTLYAKWTAKPTYTVTYDGNGYTGGSVPVDSTNYEQGQTVTVLENAGNLLKDGYSFADWNTQANGNGTTYTQAQTFEMGAANVTLYAKWTANPTYTVTYNGNVGDSGSVPVDSTNYEQGQAVTVLGNTGGLVKSGYVFAGWNTLADGSGANYAATATFTMGASNVTLYAKWGAIFTDNQDGTMTDNRTGLMWVKSPDSMLRKWQPAMDYCDTLDFAGHADWRLPTIDELKGLTQGWTGTSAFGWLISQGFSNVKADYYWSSTTYPSDTTYAWIVDMRYGGWGSVSKTTLAVYTWPVRSDLKK